jgi:glyoxylase-like metal-dependent hydrolase (beta-lactamase superfamily II)
MEPALKTRTLTPNLIQLTRFRFVNAFLLREDDGFTLVDTTLGGAADGLIEAAKQAGAPIVRIALTHGHGDHAGSLDQLKAKLPDAQVLIPELDARILSGEKVVEGKLPGSWKHVATKPDVRLQAGDRVGSLEVVATPGHSPGHVAFLDTRDRAVIGGDIFTAYGGLQVSNHFSVPFPFAAMATWDKAKDLEAARTLRALAPSLLAVGHGPARRNPADAMDAAIAKA